MPKHITKQIIGKKYGAWTVIGLTEPKQHGSKHQRLAVAKCECGTIKEVVPRILRDGSSKSCGCQKGRHRHSWAGGYSRTYTSWAMMLGRCRNPNNERYASYGARGISVCERWLSFDNFLADMGERPPNASIDRIDVNQGYNPSNCRWASPVEQMRNKRNSIIVNIGGEKLTLKEACRAYNQDYGRARRLIHKYGWPPFCAVAGELIAYG